jgi:hypothetical protein
MGGHVEGRYFVQLKGWLVQHGSHIKAQVLTSILAYYRLRIPTCGQH